jgi:phage baseplate assembly protein W
VADAHLLTDLALRLHFADARPVYTVDTDGRDLTLISGRENLGQAILMRILTPMGELAALAHPDYGCRLWDLIGRPNTATTRNLMKLHILEALALEPRVAKVLKVSVDDVPGTRGTVAIEIAVLPVAASNPIVIGPFTLEVTP